MVETFYARGKFLVLIHPVRVVVCRAYSHAFAIKFKFLPTDKLPAGATLGVTCKSILASEACSFHYLTTNTY